MLLDCVILFYYLTQLELFVAFSKVNNEIALKETTARQLAKSEKRKNLDNIFGTGSFCVIIFRYGI
jgi:hypothetical protein